MSHEDYRRALVAHNDAVQDVLAELSEPTRVFLRQNFRLDLYPTEWVRTFGLKLEEFRGGAGAGSLGLDPQWRDIASAPKDGTRILINSTYRSSPYEDPPSDPLGVEIAWWDGQQWCSCEKEPTHWLALPKPPQ